MAWRQRLIIMKAPWGQPVDRFVVRWAGFSPMTFQYGLAGGMPVAKAWRNARRSLLLTTVGRRTGRLHTTVLPWFPDGDATVICGTNGGGPRDPQWVDNIRAGGGVWVRFGTAPQQPVDAHVAEGAERERVFESILPDHDGLARYQHMASKHGRDVPLVVISSQ